MMNSCVIAAVLALVILGGCGGGASTDVLTTCTGNQAHEVNPGYEGNGSPGEDGIGIGASDGSGIGAGGALGQFKAVRVVVRQLESGRVLAEGKTDSDKGMVTIKLCNFNAPFEVEFLGGEGSEYFDEARNAFVPFPEGSRVRVRVPDANRGFIGVTPYTEAAVEFHVASTPPSAGFPTGKATATEISDANDRVAAVLADQLPGAYRADGAAGRFRIEGLPQVLNNQNVTVSGTLTDNDRGRYSAVTAGLSRLAGTFLPDDPTPSLTITRQLARDMSDGRLDLTDSNGCSVAAEDCNDSFGALLSYSYETLWRAKTVATGKVAVDAGDTELSAKRALLAEISSASQKVYTACRGGSSICQPFVTRTDLGQLVRLDNLGVLHIERGIAAGFANEIDWVVDVRSERTLDGRFVDVRVGSRGDIIALRDTRDEIVYLPAVPVYEVTGLEPSTEAARNALMQSISSYDAIVVPVATARVLSFTDAPEDRLVGSALARSVFIYTRNDGRLVGVSIDANGRADQQQLPTIIPVSSAVYDKFVPPAVDPAYGIPVGSTFERPWSGPRRLYLLTRSGQVRVVLETATGSPGVLLDIPGTVVQLASESSVGVYALNSEGQVFWINADQAGQPLHAIVPVPLPEPACWIARHEAVGCQTGRVFSWREITEELEVRLPGTPADAQLDVIRVPRDIGAAEVVDLGNRTTPIWRMTGIQEFSLRSRTRGSFDTKGMRYLPVDGSTPIDAAGGRVGARNLLNSRCLFGGKPERYLEGWQVRRGLKAALRRLGSEPIQWRSNEQSLAIPTERPAMAANGGFAIELAASAWSGPDLLPPAVATDPANCDASQTENSVRLPSGPPDPLGSQGFSLTPFSVRSRVLADSGNGTLTDASEIPAITLSGTVGERGDEFFIDLNKFNLLANVVGGRSHERIPDNQVEIWRNDGKYRLDWTAQAWGYSYFSGISADGPFEQFFDTNPPAERKEATECTNEAYCVYVKLIPMTVFGDPSAFRLCFSQFAVTGFSRIERLTCTVHEFNGDVRSTSAIERWYYPPLNQSEPSQIDFQHLYGGAN